MLARKNGVKPESEGGREVRHFRVNWLGLLPGNAWGYLFAYTDPESETGESVWLADYARTDPKLPQAWWGWVISESPGDELWAEVCGWFGTYQYLDTIKLYWKASPDAAAKEDGK